MSTNALSWPLSSAWYSPAAITGACLVDLCQPIQRGGPAPSCTTIAALCTAGSTTISDTGYPGSQNIPCGYQSQNVTLTDGTTANVACGLMSFTAAAVQIHGDLIQLASPGMASQLTDIPTTTNLNALVPVWPATALNVSDPNALKALTPFLVSASSSSSGSSGSTKSGGIKTMNLSTLAVTTGLVLSITASAFL